VPKELNVILIERTWIPASAGMTKSEIWQSINEIGISHMGEKRVKNIGALNIEKDCELKLTALYVHIGSSCR
jgi:hypothetical protein